MGGEQEILSSIKKRDGRVVEFELSKIEEAIFKAARSVGGSDRDTAQDLAKQVHITVTERFSKIPTVEDIQDVVEEVLIKNQHDKTAKAYILYRSKQADAREQRGKILGIPNKEDNLLFSQEALRILERRYLKKEDTGILETPKEMLRRVAHAIAHVELEQHESETEQRFYEVMANLEFLPSSPMLLNAGTPTPQLFSCYVLPIEDSIDGIYQTLKEGAIIQKMGAGTGYSFSRLRPAKDQAGKRLNVAAGPVGFMHLFDASADAIKQGGKRKGANMAVLDVTHPDIEQFIAAKDGSKLKNFNISVAATQKFMDAVEKNDTFGLIHPSTGKEVKQPPAKNLFNTLIYHAWKTGEPGVIFIDRMNDSNPLRHVGKIESTSPCGEQPLLSYEGSPLGSINLVKMISEGVFDFDKLKKIVQVAVHFLDNSLDANHYPSEIIRQQCQNGRRIGLGIMGLADVFYSLGISYESDAALDLAEKIMKVIQTSAEEMSMDLADLRGVYPHWKGSQHEKDGKKMRNAALTAISPNGTISLLAHCSPGCEPVFALAYMKKIIGTEAMYTNETFERVAREEQFYTEDLMRSIAQTGTVQNESSVPENHRKVFVVATDISAEAHVKMQATLQKYIDGAISKTINFPADATVDEVASAYLLAYKLGCKGITIYRDSSVEGQVHTIGT